ncbi:hypothetical protein B0H19DRAFT_1233400 [Mycena capillaripes]|nr:hypothetical protein B0H19DRAFT_1233400 [Mycena capillaripes]
MSARDVGRHEPTADRSVHCGKPVEVACERRGQLCPPSRRIRARRRVLQADSGSVRSPSLGLASRNGGGSGVLQPSPGLAHEGRGDSALCRTRSGYTTELQRQSGRSVEPDGREMLVYRLSKQGDADQVETTVLRFYPSNARILRYRPAAGTRRYPDLQTIPEISIPPVEVTVNGDSSDK